MTGFHTTRTGAAALLASALALADMGVSRAVDLGAYIPSPAPYQGIACADGAPPQWPAVWLGHFQGGQSSYNGVETALHWVDVKMCFPSQRLCGAYIRQLRREFHRPVGYFTCLPLR